MTIVRSAPVPFIAQYERFLAATWNREAALTGFYRQAHAELNDFLLHPPVALTASEQAFYGALNTEVDRASKEALASATGWAKNVPASFVEGALQHSPGIAFNVVHENATRALSGYTLDLITRMSADMQAVVRQQIGVGLLTGATREVVSQRLLESGLTNIPHWRSVEERAAAIARTELMRAYNAGNLAGIVDTGAFAVRWITGNDERVCPICGPRHGQYFKLPGLTDEATDPSIRNLPTLEPPPAHVKCRCTIRAAYDFGGVETTPVPPAGGVIEETPTPVPPASPIPSPAEEFAHKVDDLKLQFPSDSTYWHDIDLDDARLARVAGEVSDEAAMRHFVTSRYGVEKFEIRDSKMLAYWQAEGEVRLGTLKALERYRLAFRRNVDGSSYFKSLAFDNRGMGLSTLADCSYAGEIRLALTRFTKYLKPGSGVRTTAADVSGVEEIMVHELGHALHNRFGVIFSKTRRMGALGTKAVELGGGYAHTNSRIAAIWKEFESIRRKSKGGIWSDDLMNVADRIRDSELRIAAYEKAVAGWDALPIVKIAGREYDRVSGKFIDAQISVRELAYRKADGTRVVETFRDEFNIRFSITTEQTALARWRELKKKVAAGGEFYPTDYAKTNMREDFAESSMLFLIDPARLKRSSPLRYAFMKKLFASLDEPIA
jgi:SPP1 gp7 family putative phage head morphogenesis protein